MDESVTTEANGNGASGQLSKEVTADEITVTFNGAEYQCSRSGSNDYGAPYASGGYDWSEYPFAIYGNNIDTETAGTYSVKISAPGEVVDLSECFIKAVQKAMNFITVTFVDDGGPCGDGSVVQTVTLQKGESIAEEPQVPHQTCGVGYSFTGWREEGASENASFPYAPTESVTLHSRYTYYG